MLYMAIGDAKNLSDIIEECYKWLGQDWFALKSSYPFCINLKLLRFYANAYASAIFLYVISIFRTLEVDAAKLSISPSVPIVEENVFITEIAIDT